MGYVVHYSADMCGTDVAEVTDDDAYTSSIEVYAAYEDDAWVHFWNYNTEEGFCDVEPELDLWVEEFNPNNSDHIELLS